MDKEAFYICIDTYKKEIIKTLRRINKLSAKVTKLKSEVITLVTYIINEPTNDKIFYSHILPISDKLYRTYDDHYIYVLYNTESLWQSKAGISLTGISLDEINYILNLKGKYPIVKSICFHGDSDALEKIAMITKCKISHILTMNYKIAHCKRLIYDILANLIEFISSSNRNVEFVSQYPDDFCTIADIDALLNINVADELIFNNDKYEAHQVRATQKLMESNSILIEFYSEIQRKLFENRANLIHFLTNAQ